MSQKYINGVILEEDAKDIEELKTNIEKFRKGAIQEERFKHYRLTRGVYGQRQFGVHMFRLKIPYGRISAAQLAAVADISDQYSTGNLHLTTRQNIQLHYVKLDDSPKVWEALAESGLTAREACGNTVRNFTASPTAGIDPQEAFDVSPYVQAAFEYFLRNSICQDMGRKIKASFSGSEKDTAFGYFHDFGFIAKTRVRNYREERGFKVLLGGGLGAQAIFAQEAYDFLPADEIIPFMEAAIRVFDRHGEREKRLKARLKFLLKKIGLENFLELVEQERKALPNQKIPIEIEKYAEAEIPKNSNFEITKTQNAKHYNNWLRTNVFQQKQQDFYGVYIKVRLGDIDSNTARKLADLIPQYAADDIRITINQGLLLRFVSPEALPHLFNALYELDLADTGFESIADVTACPGTDTCNLGVTNSTGLAKVLEETVRAEFPELLFHKELSVKISGCMNSCGQHMAASIGFHGSSIKTDQGIAPAMQLVLGGGSAPNGQGYLAERIIKFPTRRAPEALQRILKDYTAYQQREEHFPAYVKRQGRKYFYGLLKDLGDKQKIQAEDYIDWGQEQKYQQAIGVGECAGVSYDMVTTILQDAKDKIPLAKAAFLANALSDSIYQSYSAMVIAAKALLLGEDVNCNTHIGIIRDFQTHFVEAEKLKLKEDFESKVLQIRKNDPTPEFAEAYFKEAETFVQWAEHYRKASLNGEKLVVDAYYHA